MNEIVLMSHSSDLENSETYGPAVVGTITTRYGKRKRLCMQKIWRQTNNMELTRENLKI
jgi:hypothetical protein